MALDMTKFYHPPDWLNVLYCSYPLPRHCQIISKQAKPNTPTTAASHGLTFRCSYYMIRSTSQLEYDAFCWPHGGDGWVEVLVYSHAVLSPPGTKKTQDTLYQTSPRSRSTALRIQPNTTILLWRPINRRKYLILQDVTACTSVTTLIQYTMQRKSN